MKRWTIIFTTVFVLAMVVFGCSNSPQPEKVLVTKPASGDWLLSKYPILKKSQLTPKKIMELGLSPDLLEKETWLLTSNGKGPRDFTYKPFPAGTIVLVNKSGEVVYVYDCANRSYIPLVTEWITPPAGQKPTPGVPVVPGTPASPQGVSGGGGFWHSLNNGLGNGLGTIGKWVLWLLAALIGAAIIGWILYHLLPWLFPPKKEEKKEEPSDTSKKEVVMDDGGKKGSEAPIVSGTPELDFIPGPGETGVGIFRGPNGLRVVSHGKTETIIKPDGIGVIIH